MGVLYCIVGSKEVDGTRPLLGMAAGKNPAARGSQSKPMKGTLRLQLTSKKHSYRRAIEGVEAQAAIPEAV